MPTTGTQAFDVKEKLIELTKANTAIAALEGWEEHGEIWDSAYVGADRPRLLIWFGEIVWDREEAVLAGNSTGSREEDFNVRYGIEVHMGDDTQTDANRRMQAIQRELEIMLVDQRVLAVAGGFRIRQVDVRPIGLGEGADPSGRAAVLAAQVHVIVRK